MCTIPPLSHYACHNARWLLTVALVSRTKSSTIARSRRQGCWRCVALLLRAEGSGPFVMGALSVFTRKVELWNRVYQLFSCLPFATLSALLRPCRHRLPVDTPSEGHDGEEYVRYVAKSKPFYLTEEDEAVVVSIMNKLGTDEETCGVRQAWLLLAFVV